MTVRERHTLTRRSYDQSHAEHIEDTSEAVSAYGHTPALLSSQLALLNIHLIKAADQADMTAPMWPAFKNLVSLCGILAKALYYSLLIHLVLFAFFRRQNDGTRLFDLAAEADSNAVPFGNGK